MEVMGESSINSSQVYTPQVDNQFIPKVKQEFDSLSTAFEFYNTYAFQGGFSIRMHSSNKDRAGEIIRKVFVCCKQGVRKSKTPNEPPSQRKRGEIREGCGAMVALVLDRKSSKYVVSTFVESHNHTLSSPRRVHLLPSHRKVSLAKRNLTRHLGDANVPTCQQMSIFELQVGGLQNVGCTQRDLYNAERDRRKSLEGYDVEFLYEHFQLRQEKNPGFFFTFQKDDEGRMTHCFWVDARSRKSYTYFGDVVVFDTTYNTNRYSLIFAPIVGVNHHGQTTLFGCAFLSDETSDSFEWLFTQWLNAMPAGPPKMIITDQDPAMTKALANVLPNTHHRYCIWHILSKFSEKISAVAFKEHYEEFSKCIWNTETPEEFDASWEVIVTKANLSTNEWLQNLFNIRDRWVPAYTRHIFSAHMTSSQRAESEHSFFKRYVSPHCTLVDFVSRFDRAMSRIRHNELELDHKDVHEKPQLKSQTLMELRMSEKYTRTVFYKLQEQLHEGGAYGVMRVYKDDKHSKYEIRRLVSDSGARSRQITVDKSSKHVRCSCMKFESDGIPCRHMLAYFLRKGIAELPDEYILERWTKASVAARVFDDLGGRELYVHNTSLLETRDELFRVATRMIDEALLSSEGILFLRNAMDSTVSELLLLHKSTNANQGQGSHIDGRIPIPREHGLKEPQKVRAKGCGKRLKGGKEKAVKKSRKCHGCGLTGQSHDKRNCPKLQNMSSQDPRLDDDDDEGEEEEEYTSYDEDD